MTPTIQGHELIGDLLSRYPEAAEIMENYGLHCTGCDVNAFEPLREGALSHGLSEEAVDQLIEEINELAAEKPSAPKDGILVTDKAIARILEFAKAEEKEGYGLRITAKDNAGMEPAYAMDFAEKAKDEDHTFEFATNTDGPNETLQVFLDAESKKNMLGATVDYLETQFASGFKISNPQFEKGACGSGCGCGTGKGSGSCSTGGGCGSGGCC